MGVKKRKRGDEGVEEEGSGPRKKTKREQDDLGKFLSLVEEDTLAGLTYFLTTIQRDVESTLISAYLQTHPSCEHVLTPLHWERDKRTNDVLLLCFQCLENILLYTASDESRSSTGTGPSPGTQLTRSILNEHMRPLYSSLVTSCPMKLVAACLRLLTAMVLQGRHSAREVQQSFNFAYKPLTLFPAKTHRVQGYSESVRIFFIRFALSFLIAGDNEVIRNILQLKRFLSLVFKLLPQDPVEIIHLFLSTVQQKVLRNSGVSKKAKSALFNQYALRQISLLLFRSQEEGGEAFQLAAGDNGSQPVSLTLREFVLNILTELCTSFQHGVCYRSKEEVLGTERSNNPVILHLLLSLTGAVGDADIQRLVIRAMATCPDLLVPYQLSIGLSFEPRATSKWLSNINYLINLFSGLPSVPEALGLCGNGQSLPASLVPTAVALTVPRAMTRAMFNQGVQSVTPLVKLKTMTLIDVTLKRAAEMISFAKREMQVPLSPSLCGHTSFLLHYSDSVLKLLPVIKTVINFRQQLLTPAKPPLEVLKKEGDSLSLEEKVQNAALREDSTLLALCLTVMRRYQFLSPSLFTQADFSPAKLLPSLSELRVGVRGCLGDPAVLLATLNLLGESSSDYLQWRQQKSGVLTSLLWLTVCGGKELSGTAMGLTLRLLLSVDCLASYPIEVEVLLVAARNFCEVCLPLCRAEEEGEEKETSEKRTKQKKRKKQEEEGKEAEEDSKEKEDDERASFVLSLAGMFSSLAKNPHLYMTEMEQVVEEGERTPDLHVEQLPVEDIIAAPLKLPTPAEVEALSSLPSRPQPPPSHCCPLLPALLSTINAGKYFPFISDVATKLLLVQDSFHSSRILAHLFLHHLSPVEEDLRNGPWAVLYQSLLELLRHWAGDTHVDMEVEAQPGEVAALSVRKVKKMLKTTVDPVSRVAMELFSAMSQEQILDCWVAVAPREDLLWTLCYCLGLRPLHLLGCYDHPSVQELLPSLPFSTLLLQSIQLEPPTSPSSPPSPPFPLSSLATSLAVLPMESLTCSLRLSLSSCAWVARAVLLLLLEVYRSNNGELTSVVEVCFQLLIELVTGISTCGEDRIPSGSKEGVESTHPSPHQSLSPLLETIFNSQLVQDILPIKVHSNDGVEMCMGSDGGPKLHIACLDGVGKLLTCALKCSEDVRRCMWCCRIVCDVLDSLEMLAQCPEEICSPLLRVFHAVKPSLDADQLISSTECVLHALTTTGSLKCQQTLSEAITAPHSLDSSNGDVPTHYPTTPSPLSDSSIQQLLRVNLHAPSEPLGHLALRLICRRLSVPLETVNMERWASAVWDLSDTQMFGYLLKRRALACCSLVDTSAPVLTGTEGKGQSDRLLTAVAERVQAKGLTPPSFTRACQRFCSRHRGDGAEASWLPPELLTQLLDSSAREPTLSRGALSACLLLHLPEESLEYFSSSCVPELCRHVGDRHQSGGGMGGGDNSLECVLFLLAVYLTVVDKQERVTESDLWKESIKLIRKSVWRVCLSIVAGPQHHFPSLQGLSLLVLCLLYQLSLKARKKLKKTVKSWDSEDTAWTRSQLWLVGVAACLADDSYLCCVAARRLLPSALYVTARESQEEEEEQEQEQEQEHGRKESEGGQRRVEGDGGTEATLWLLCNVFHTWDELDRLEEEEELACGIEYDVWNTFVEEALRGCLTDPCLLHLLSAAVRVVYRRSGRRKEKKRRKSKKRDDYVSLETIYKGVWSHSDFLDVMCSSHDQGHKACAKEKLVELLVGVAELCPAACQTADVATILGAYSASRSRTDRGLLYLLLLYEQNGANVGKFRPYLWGKAALELQRARQGVSWVLWQQPGAQQVLEQLDQERLRHSIEHFPQDVPLEPTNPFPCEATTGSGTDATTYDPSFMLPLLSHLLDSGSLIDCHQVVQTGCLGYLLAALSSHQEEVRRAACHSLGRLSPHLSASSVKEKQQISLLLDVVKNTMDGQAKRLPTVITAFCTQVARIFLNPEVLLYPIVGHYIVYRPSLELRDIPLFYTLLHSSSAQHSSERQWLLQLLLNGLRGEEDYRLYQRKRVFPQLLALYTSPCMDTKSQGLILELLFRACSIPVAASDLVWNHGLLVWLGQVTRESGTVLRVLSQLWCVLGEHSSEAAEVEGSKLTKAPPLLEEELALAAYRVTSWLYFCN